MKKYFFSGLAILLPFAITLIVVLFVVNLLTAPFEGAVESILRYYDVFDTPFLFMKGDVVLSVMSKIFVLIALFLIIFLIGVFGQNVITKTFVKVSDYFIHRIPFVSKIYRASQEAVHTIFKADSTAFSRVVLVPFPHKNVYSIGLITNEKDQAHFTDNSVSVFVPGTPNPTMGFMLMFAKDQIIDTDMRVEEALKFVISCGIMFNDRQKL